MIDFFLGLITTIVLIIVCPTRETFEALFDVEREWDEKDKTPR